MIYTSKRAQVVIATPCSGVVRCVNFKAVEGGSALLVTKEITETFQKILKHQ